MAPNFLNSIILEKKISWLYLFNIFCTILMGMLILGAAELLKSKQELQEQHALQIEASSELLSLLNRSRLQLLDIVYNDNRKLISTLFARNEDIFGAFEKFRGIAHRNNFFIDLSFADEYGLYILNIRKNIVACVNLYRRGDALAAKQLYNGSIKKSVGLIADFVEDSNYRKKRENESLLQEIEAIRNYEVALILTLVVLIAGLNLFLGNKIKRSLTKPFIELEKANTKIMDSIEYTHIIQNSLLPELQSFTGYFHDYFILWEPRDIIGGDLYWHRSLKKGGLIAVLDCTGHGVPGACMTMLADSQLDRITADWNLTDPGRILNKLDELVQQALGQSEGYAYTSNGLDIGLCRLDPDKKNLYFAGANIALFHLTGGGVRIIKGDRKSIGDRNANFSQFNTHRIEIQPDSQFYLATDGIIDQCGGEKRFPFGKKRLLALLQEYQNRSMKEQKIALQNAFQQYQGSETRRDDITILGFRLKIKTLEAQNDSQPAGT